MIFNSINKIFGILSYRRKLFITILILFMLSIALTYNLNKKIFYDRLDAVSIGIVERNSNYIIQLIDSTIQNSKIITKKYANNKNIINAIKNNNADVIEQEFDLALLSHFNIEYYIITKNGQVIFLDQGFKKSELFESNETIINFLKNNTDIINKKNNTFFENIYHLPNIDANSLFYICAIPIKIPNSDEFAKLITVTKIRTNDIYNLLKTSFKVTNSDITFFNLNDKKNPDETDKLMQRTINSYFVNDRSKIITVFETEKVPPSFARYIIYDKYENRIIIRVNIYSPLLVSELSVEFKKSVLHFNIICILILVLVFIIVYYSVNHVLIHLRIMTKILLYINNTGKVSLEDIKKIQNEIEETGTKDEYGLLLSEFNTFLIKNRHLFIDDKTSNSIE